MNGTLTITNSEYRLISNLVYDKIGINLGENKRALVMGRLQKLVNKYGFNNFKDYYNHVVNEENFSALSELFDRISTNHTYFYREHDHFEFFSNTVLPEIEKKLRTQFESRLRIWVPGCSSGEEPYTLAMLLVEYFGKKVFDWGQVILSTDISTKVLDIASKGEYFEENVSKLPPKLKNNYFFKLPDGKRVVKNEIKNMILFRRLNLMDTVFPFKHKFHMISCRNVMIYFDNPTRNNLIEKFYRHSLDGSYLFIGHSESLTRHNRLYRYIKPAIYRKDGVN